MLTLNTHSLIEENYKEKMLYFVEGILETKPDIIALQEVNQSLAADMVSEKELLRYHRCKEGVIIRNDNHVWNIVKLLNEKGVFYNWTWLPLKKGYERFEEGIAVLSRSNINGIDVIQVSKTEEYENWKNRKILGIRVEAFPQEWFYSVHYGWWEDIEEPFSYQWKQTIENIPEKKIWLLGDFNNPSEIRDQGYEMVKKSGWFDTYLLAAKNDSGVTVKTVIDGWKEKIQDTTGMRIDQIWCNKLVKVKESKLIFNGKNYPVVSDHFGVLLEVEEGR